MNRRELVLGLSVAHTSNIAGAMAQERIRRIAVLGLVDAPMFRSITLPALDRLGFTEGRNLVIASRFGPADQLSSLARDLIALGPDLIVANSDWAMHAVFSETRTIPVITAPMGADPVASGVAVSWAKPGGNVTGVSLIAPELELKRFDLLREIVPAVRRIGLLSNHRQVVATGLGPLRDTAKKNGIELIEFWIDTPADYLNSFAAMRLARIDAVLIVPTPELTRDVEQLAKLAVEAGIPAVCGFRELAQRGCLLGYGPDFSDLYRRAAVYIARVLEGAYPGDLPFQSPTRFEFGVNNRTAKALGITLSVSILAGADEVIE